MKKSGTVFDKHHNPRSFIIQTDSGVLRRNRINLVPTNENNSPADTMKTTSKNGCRSHSPLCSHPKSTAVSLQQPGLQSPPSASDPLPDVPPQTVQMNETPNPTTCVTKAGRKAKKPEKLNLWTSADWYMMTMTEHTMCKRNTLHARFNHFYFCDAISLHISFCYGSFDI